MFRFYPQCNRQFRRRHDERSHIEQMMSQLLEGGLIGYLETLFNISLQDIAYQILHIILVFADNEQLRKSSLFQIMIEGMKKYVCDVCGWIYDPEVGDPEGGIAPGTAFEDIPDDWVCPLCGVGKEDFSPVEE